MARAAAFAIGLALMAAYWPGISGLATTPRWDVAAFMAVAFFFAPSVRMTRAHWTGIALVAWLIVSLAWSSGAGYGIDSAWKLIAVCVALAWGAALVDIGPLIAGAATGLSLSSAVAVAQWFGWHGIESLGSPAGLFWNGNRLAEVAVVVLAAVLARRIWWVLPGLVPAIVTPYDRAAWIAAGIVVAVWAWRQLGRFERYVSAMIVFWLVVGLAIVATTWRTDQFGFDALAERLALWKYTLVNLTWFGHGLGSFAANAPLMQWTAGHDLSRAFHPHNEWLWLAFEGGLPALGLFGAFAVFLVRSAASDSGLGLVLIAIGIESMVAMPFHDPATVLFAAVVAGHLARAHRDIRGAADARGDPLRQGDGSVYGDRSSARRDGAGVEALPV